MPDLKVEETTETVTTTRVVLSDTDLHTMVRTYLPLLFQTVDEQDAVFLKIAQRQHPYEDPVEVDGGTFIILEIVKKRSA